MRCVKSCLGAGRLGAAGAYSATPFPPTQPRNTNSMNALTFPTAMAEKDTARTTEILPRPRRKQIHALTPLNMLFHHRSP